MSQVKKAATDWHTRLIFVFEDGSKRLGSFGKFTRTFAIMNQIFKPNLLLNNLLRVRITRNKPCFVRDLKIQLLRIFDLCSFDIVLFW